MGRYLGINRLMLAWIASGLVVIGMSSCGHLIETNEQGQVKRAFESWKSAMISQQIDGAMGYIPHHVDDYLHSLNSDAGKSPLSASAAVSQSPAVDMLLRMALEKKVPADLRSNLTLATLVQRISDRHLLNPHEVQDVTLGRVTINGNRASAEVYYQGSLTALLLPFVKEDGAWKIDVMAILPYAEVLMRVDRAIKGETVEEQVDQLVSKLPSL